MKKTIRYSILITLLSYPAIAQVPATQSPIEGPVSISEKTRSALNLVPLDKFLDSTQLAKIAEGQSVDIGQGQKMHAPSVHAKLLERADIQKGDRVLEGGVGTGYLTAVISRLGKHVYSLEIDQKLAAAAEERLRNLGYTNVHIEHGDALQRAKGQEPFDKVIITFNLEQIPDELVDQVKEGGRLVKTAPGSQTEVESYIKKNGELLPEKS